LLEKRMSDSNRAVFLSYASQDADAARAVAEALRAAGVELWFDQNELVGGDAWDAKIRRQIAECALFVPVISAATQANGEGYFRLEWNWRRSVRIRRIPRRSLRRISKARSDSPPQHP
jgi:hypothetical protein